LNHTVNRLYFFTLRISYSLKVDVFVALYYLTTDEQVAALTGNKVRHDPWFLLPPDQATTYKLSVLISGTFFLLVLVLAVSFLLKDDIKEVA
jgi:hypothetical protein